jgi:putative ABC transport system permease protein
MRSGDIALFSMQAATASRGRTILTLLAMAIGVSSVILLISLGDSGRRYVIDQFASLGTNLLIVIPGRSETTGGPPPLLGETPRDLTLDDAIALRQSTAVHRVAPIIAGSAPVSVMQLEREMIILGSSAELFHVRRLGRGFFFPPVTWTAAAMFVLLAQKANPNCLATGRPWVNGSGSVTAVSG